MKVSIHTVPSAPPDSVSVSGVTPSSITVQWGMVPCIHRNGDIVGYSVEYVGARLLRTTFVSGRMTTITGLNPSTTYSIKVAAVTGPLTGVYSEEVIQQTNGGDLLYSTT